jgi:hypothetical protein
MEEMLYITNQSGFFPNVTKYCLIFKKYTHIYIYIDRQLIYSLIVLTQLMDHIQKK